MVNGRSQLYRVFLFEFFQMDIIGLFFVEENNQHQYNLYGYRCYNKILIHFALPDTRLITSCTIVVYVESVVKFVIGGRLRRGLFANPPLGSVPDGQYPGRRFLMPLTVDTGV